MKKANVILGIDFGLSKIGIAIGQMITKTAQPIAILKASKGVPEWSVLQKLIDEWGVDTIVIGLPLNMDGTEQPITKKAKTFGEAIKKRFELPLYFSDERLTSVSAREFMHTHIKGQARFANADGVSAKLIVESWMNCS